MVGSFLEHNRQSCAKIKERLSMKKKAQRTKEQNGENKHSTRGRVCDTARAQHGDAIYYRYP